MKFKKLLLIPTALFITACGPTSTPSTPTTEPSIEPSVEPSVEPQEKKIDLIVMAGQSNMEGHSWNKELQKHVSVEKYDEYIEGYEDIKICYKVGCYGNNNNSDGKFRKVRIGEGCNVSMFGPELGLAEYLNEIKDTLQNEVALVKFAVGATTIYKEWRSPSSVTAGFDKGYLYTPFINYIAKAVATLEEEGYTPTVKAVCWMQGESDGTYASYYEELEDNFIKDVVNDLAIYNEEETIKFIDAGIYDASWVQNYHIVNRSKKLNAAKDDENRFYFDTIEAGLDYRNEPEGSPDLAHFDSQDMIELGRLFGSTLIENAII